MSQELAIRPQITNDDFIILDTRAPNGVAQTVEKPRMNAIATISGGFRDAQNRPARTQSGEIYVHGDAPHLVATLAARDNKSLTIAFPSDNPRDFIQQRFSEYSATALKTYGDENSVTEIQGERRVVHQAGTPEYAAAIARCKVSISVYFMLAEWVEGGADMIFDDGMGLYRLRFTSSNSLHSILHAVHYMKKMTGGHIAGVPFDLFLRQEEHSDGKGMKRNVWIWQAIPRPPQGVRLTASQFRQFADYGQQQIGMLQLTAPAPETIENALMEAAPVDLDESGADETIAEGEIEEEVSPAGFVAPTPPPTASPACDVNQWRKTYFAVAGKTSLASDVGRKDFIASFTGGETESLTQFLGSATESQAQAMVDALERDVEDDRTAGALDEYEKLSKDASDRGHKAGNGRPWPMTLNAQKYNREQIENFAATLRAELAQYPDDLEMTAPPQPEAPQAAPKTINQAVAEKREEAAVDQNPTETEAIFGDDDEPSAEAAELARDLNLPKSIGDLLEAADTAGFKHGGDVTFGPLLAAINGTAKDFKLKDRITTLETLTEMQAGLIETQLRVGRMKP